MDGYASGSALPATSWARWLHEVFSLWMAHLPVWLTLGALAWGLMAIVPRSGPLLGRAIALLLGTLFNIVVVHTAFQYARGETPSRQSLLVALHAFLPVLLLQVLSVIFFLIFLFISFIGTLVIFHSIDTPQTYMLFLLAWTFGFILTHTVTLLAVPIILAERVWTFTALARWWAMLPGHAFSVLLLMLVLYSPIVFAVFTYPYIIQISRFWLVWQLIFSVVYYFVSVLWVQLAAVTIYRDLRGEEPEMENSHLFR